MILNNSNYGILNQNQLQVELYTPTARVVKQISIIFKGCIHKFRWLYMAVYTIPQITIDSWYKPFPVTGGFLLFYPHNSHVPDISDSAWRPGDGERGLRQHSGGAGGELGFLFFWARGMSIVCMPFPNEWRFLAGKFIYQWAIYTMAVTIYNIYIYMYIFFPIFYLDKK